MRKLRPREQEFWQRYLRSLPESARPLDPFVEANYCGNREITDELLALYLQGKKHAGSGLVKDYETAGDPLPQVGNYWIILDSGDNPRCLVRTVAVERHLFRNIPAKIAQAEGEGDGSVDYWKRVHGELYRPFLAQWGITSLDEAEVVTEFFELLCR
jgi:5-formyltetrahydrofolate cyclo-ligase